MEELRSRSYGGGAMQMDRFNGVMSAPENMQELRSYSASYANPSQLPNQKIKMKRNKSNFGSSSGKSWNFNDPELQRKKRVAGYKVYTVEGKMKGSLKKSFRWIKDTCTQVTHGWK